MNDGYRRVSPVAVRPGEGPLTERTAGVQPAQSERVFMPLRRHSHRERWRVLPTAVLKKPAAAFWSPFHGQCC